MDKKTTSDVLVVDATHQLVGRLATQVARAALHGKTVRVINSEKAVMSGKKKVILDDYKQRYQRGATREGPFTHRQPDRIVRRVIRGMLPYKTTRGNDAFKRIMCYIGTPVQLREATPVRFAGADVSKLPTTRWVSIGEISKELGGKWNE